MSHAAIVQMGALIKTVTLREIVIPTSEARDGRGRMRVAVLLTRQLSLVGASLPPAGVLFWGPSTLSLSL